MFGPLPDAAAESACPADSFAAAGRLRTPRATIAADSAKLAASSTRASGAPVAATSTPPTAKPANPAVCVVIARAERPMVYLSAVSTTGVVAVRAAFSGESSSWAVKSRAPRAAKGMCGTAISAISPVRATSHTIITSRLGCRSAKPASSGPPSSAGTKVSE